MAAIVPIYGDGSYVSFSIATYNYVDNLVATSIL